MALVMGGVSTNALIERVRQAKDAGTVGDLIDELRIKTIDGVVIRLGMEVVDYDFRKTTVTGIQSVANDGTVWFETGTGMFDGLRLWARMP